MKTPRTTVLTQILVATLVPTVVVFVIVIYMINSMALRAGQEVVREKSTATAENAVHRMQTTFSTFSVQVEVLSRCIALVIDDADDARRDAESMAMALMKSNPSIYCVWFVFEPGAFHPDARFKRSYLRKGDAVREISDLRDEDLNLPERSPWYNIPYQTGKPYFDSVDYYDYGDGPEYSGTITFPVFREDGAVAGCVGLDVHYRQIFDFLAAPDAERGAVLLTTEDGEIVFANHYGQAHANLLDATFPPEGRDRLAAGLSSRKRTLLETRSPFMNAGVLINLIPLDLPEASRPLYLYVEKPAATVFARTLHSEYAIILIALAGAVVLVVCVFLVTRNIVQPVRHIVANATSIASGRHEEYRPLFAADARSTNEVVLLEKSVGSMLEQLREQHGLKLAAIQANHEVEKVNAASEARMQFFANMSHEIRTPMNAVLGLSELLAHESLTPQQMHWVRDIKVSTESLLGVINDVLDLSRIELGKLELKHIDFDFSELVDSFCSVGQFLAEKKGLRFECSLADDVPRFIYGDPGRARQIVMNVLGNAVKYTAQGWVRFSVTCTREDILFDVADSGIGIRADDLDNMFHAYRKFDSRRNRNVQGTGLGLSIASGLAELMGGGIEVTSKYGVGSEFRIRLPNRPGDPNKVKTNSTRVGTHYRTDARVLIVDDNRINLVAAGGLMKIMGLEYDTVMSGLEAIKKVQQVDYDIVFMDHMMPEMDGITATRKIRELGGTHRNQVIVALTANVVAMSRDAFIQAGMSDFLAKPIEKRKLRELLEKWLPEEGTANA